MSKMTDADFRRAVRNADAYELNKLMELSLGRIFGMMQRPSRDGDVAEFERCRYIFTTCYEALGGKLKTSDMGGIYARVMGGSNGAPIMERAGAQGDA